MASVRLYKSQIEYLRRKAGIDTLMTAIIRYGNGKLVTENTDFEKKSEKLLPFSTHQKITMDPKVLRAVLFAHMRTGLDLTGEIAAVGDEIDQWFTLLNQSPYIEEKEV